MRALVLSFASGVCIWCLPHVGQVERWVETRRNRHPQDYGLLAVREVPQRPASAGTPRMTNSTMTAAET